MNDPSKIQEYGIVSISETCSIPIRLKMQVNLEKGSSNFKCTISNIPDFRQKKKKLNFIE